MSLVVVVVGAGLTPKLGLLSLSGEVPVFPFSEQMKALVKQEASYLWLKLLGCSSI
jgi:hypothetical protein